MVVLLFFLFVLLMAIVVGTNIKQKNTTLNTVPQEITSFCCSKDLFLKSLKELNKDKQWLETIIFSGYRKEKHFIGMLAESKKVSYVYDFKKYSSLEELITYNFTDEDFSMEILGVGEWLQEPLTDFSYKVEYDIRQYEELFDKEYST